MFIMWAFSTTQLGSIKPSLIFLFLYICVFSMTWLLFTIVILRKWEISIKEDFTTKIELNLMLFLTAYQNRFIKKANWASAIEIFVRYYRTSSILYGPFFLYNIIFMLLFCDFIIHWVVKFYFSLLFWIPFKRFIEWSYWAITNKKFKSFWDFHIQNYSLQKYKCLSWNISSPI